MRQTEKKIRLIDWAALGWAFLFFWYFSGLMQSVIQVMGFSTFVGFRQALLVSLLWLVPLILFPRQTKKISAGIGIMLWLCSLPALTYFLVYRQEFSQSVIFIIFESNIAEGTEYLQQYFSWWVVFFLVAYTAVAYCLWKKVRPIEVAPSAKVGFALFFFISSVGYQAVNQLAQGDDFYDALVTYQKRLEPAVPFQLLVGYVAYRQQLENMQALLEQNQSLAPLGNLTDTTQGRPATLVLVIGESTNRQRMSLYGYNRNTTPELDKMRSELTVFDNVVTPIPYTIEALQRVLTFANEQHPDAYLTRPSLINMMEQAGYKSYWITNQQTLTQRNTMLTVFSKQADQQVYLNNNREQNARQYDDDVLAPFADALKDTAPRKFIVVHLLGTHVKYEYRYPEDRIIFKDRTGAPDYLTDDELETYNSYDNAVHFNDYVVSSLIKELKASQENGFLAYLSDHGEAVYDPDHPDVLGRNTGAPTDDMYTVPMFFWFSPSWQKKHPRSFAGMLSRPYNSENFIYTWADLAGLNFTGFDASYSVVNKDFVTRPLYASDQIKSQFLKKNILQEKKLSAR